MELSQEILENLKCSECQEYLSCTPVAIKQDGDSVCGRCYVSGDVSLVRNKAYERIVKGVVFPCKYHTDGCVVKLAASEMIQHENECNFHQYKCPVMPTNSCSWKGNGQNLLKHYSDIHRDLVSTHPCDIKLTIKENRDENILTTAYGFLFLIQIRCRTAFDRFWLGVRLLNDPRLTDLFVYTVVISNESVKSAKKMRVLNHKRMPVIQTNGAVEFSIAQILNDFKLDETVAFNVAIQMDDVKCCRCKTVMNREPIHATGDGFTCAACNHTRACRFAGKGCTFKNSDLNVGKHEKWLCKFTGTTCKKCRTVLRETSPLDHDIEKHATFRCPRSSLELREIEADKSYRAVVNAYDAVFYCMWKLDGQSLDFDVVSNLVKTENKRFRFALSLLDPQDPSVTVLEKEIEPVDRNDYYFDWDLTLKDKSCASAISQMDTYHIIVKITELVEDN